jgi:hypothetical protein
MNVRRRKIMLLAAVALVAAGIILLGYVYWPLPHRQLIEAAPATLFILPP